MHLAASHLASRRQQYDGDVSLHPDPRRQAICRTRRRTRTQSPVPGATSRFNDKVTSADMAPGVSRAERLCHEALVAVDVDGAGLSMMTSAGHRGTVCATDDVARRIEDLQFAFGEGPCFDAFSGGGPMFVEDMSVALSADNGRWPVFTEAVATTGAAALFAFPLLIGAIPLGALDLYRRRPGALTQLQLRAAWRIADAAAGALLDMRSGTAMDLPADTAPVGASYRLEVHQATGMVSVQLGVPMDEAFLRLRAYAYARDLDIDEVARTVVIGGLQLRSEED
jgi:GAF domain-containing protein/ANTAR domain-containing protein